MTALAPTRSSAGLGRRIAFAVPAVLFGLLAILAFGTNALVPLLTDIGGVHFVHDLAFTLFGVVVLAGLLAQIGGARRPGAMVQVVAFPLLLVVGLIVGQLFVPPAVIMAVLGVAAGALHPRAGEMLRAVGDRSLPLLGLALIGIVPALVYAADQLNLQRTLPAADPHTEFGHWLGMAVLAVLLPLLAAVAGLRPAGWLVPALTAAVGAVLFGAASLAYPGLPSSLGTAWGLAAVAWGVAVGGLAVATLAAGRRAGR